MRKAETVPTTDADAIIYHTVYQGRPKRGAGLAKAEIRAQAAVAVYEMRNRLGLSQKDFAQRVGLPVEVIDGLEESDSCVDNPLEIVEQIKEQLDDQDIDPPEEENQ